MHGTYGLIRTRALTSTDKSGNSNRHVDVNENEDDDRNTHGNQKGLRKSPTHSDLNRGEVTKSLLVISPFRFRFPFRFACSSSRTGRR
jgi:hypothetical protein